MIALIIACAGGPHETASTHDTIEHHVVELANGETGELCYGAEPYQLVLCSFTEAGEDCHAVNDQRWINGCLMATGKREVEAAVVTAPENGAYRLSWWE